ncbi:hypothetical protein HZH68_007165 [Vespula germanica]|uniref:Uncharacterized protein n=1 Tax=Vespula germanica TaxID=30212 RepID=A0A834NA07_VESGE|nr:hypothetical protein HZH68_007165 [Vespula germanica]
MGGLMTSRKTGTAPGFHRESTNPLGFVSCSANNPTDRYLPFIGLFVIIHPEDGGCKNAFHYSHGGSGRGAGDGDGKEELFSPKRWMQEGKRVVPPLMMHKLGTLMGRASPGNIV